eukprot:6195648-Pleurochrysis_carterae.AAC.2
MPTAAFSLSCLTVAFYTHPPRLQLPDPLQLAAPLTWRPKPVQPHPWPPYLLQQKPRSRRDSLVAQNTAPSRTRAANAPLPCHRPSGWLFVHSSAA